jgi:tetratricopeptide (TPR) repeat protein
MSSDSNKHPAVSASASTLVVSPALRKKLQQCYEHGTKLMQQEKYDFNYAHSILIECVVHDPGNLVYVEAFLQNLQRKYNNNKRGAMLALGGKGPFKKALAKKDWPEALKLGPEVLKSNPWDVSTLRGMAEACAELGFGEVELRYLKNALDHNPKDAEVNKHCAQSLARIGQFDQAIICWQRVDEAKRGDDEAQRMISELQIAKTLGRGGAVTGELARRNAAAKAARQAAELEQTQKATPNEPVRREIKLTRRQQLEQDISNRPTDIEAYLDLAQLHIEEDRLAESAHVLSRALSASGNSLKIQERVEDVEILRRKQQLQVAERRAHSEPSDAAQQLVNQLRDDLNRFELEVFDRRTQRYPQDLELKFQLGLRLKRVGNFREALKHFELSQDLPERRSGSALELGECLQRQKQYDKALESYRVAAEELSPDRIEVKKLALYRLGLLAEGLKHWDVAERGLSELVSLDSHYKDASTRLDKLRGMRHKHT